MTIQIIKVHIPYGSVIHHSSITRYMTSANVIWEKPTLISWLRNPGNSAYVIDSAGDQAYCQVVDANPPYIKTRPDGIIADNLLSLPRF